MRPPLATCEGGRDESGGGAWGMAGVQQHLRGNDGRPGCHHACNAVHACAAVTALLCRPQLHCNSSARQAAAAL